MTCKHFALNGILAVILALVAGCGHHPAYQAAISFDGERVQVVVGNKDSGERIATVILPAVEMRFKDGRLSVAPGMKEKDSSSFGGNDILRSDEERTDHDLATNDSDGWSGGWAFHIGPHKFVVSDEKLRVDGKDYTASTHSPINIDLR